MAKVTRRMAKLRRKVFATILDCPFGGVGPDAVDPLPVPVPGGLTTTEGRGGSVTLFSVRTGSGASAGGRREGAIN